MKVWRAQWQATADLDVWRAAGETIALVPTMGNLHLGHLSLIDNIRQQANRVVASIFVNPLQFGVHEDFDSYPRTETQDLALLKAHHCDGVWIPDVSEMYGGVDLLSHTAVMPDPFVAEQLEGAVRPGHFSGVLTVVLKLFNQIMPDIATFGQKDYQQYCLIQQMVSDFNISIRLLMGETIRENNGLAMSSRNHYLTEAEKQQAGLLHTTLQQMKTDYKNAIGGIRQQCELDGLITAVEWQAKQMLESNGLPVDYCRLLDHNLHKLRFTDACVQLQDLPRRVAIAAIRIRQTRLLDNLLF